MPLLYYSVGSMKMSVPIVLSRFLVRVPTLELSAYLGTVCTLVMLFMSASPVKLYWERLSPCTTIRLFTGDLGELFVAGFVRK